MIDEEKKAIISRLRRVEGQIRGLQRMIDQDRSCEEIITQVTAAEAALNKAALLIMQRHLGQCLLKADDEERNKSVKDMLELLFKMKVS